MPCPAGAGNKKKSRLLNGSLDFTGTKALRAYTKLACLSSADIDTDTLNVDQPATSGMTVGVAYGISRSRSAAAAITELGQFYSPLVPRNIQPGYCITVYKKLATIVLEERP